MPGDGIHGGFQSFDDLKAGTTVNRGGASIQNVKNRNHIEFLSDNDYEVYNACGANGRSQFM